MSILVWVVLGLVLVGSILAAWLTGGWSRVAAVAALMVVIATIHDQFRRNRR